MRSLPAAVMLLTTMVALSTAKIPFNPIFPVSQYQIIEGGQQEIHLSAPVLTRPQTPAFNGSIEVDVTAEDLPSKDTRQNAEFLSDYLVNIQNPMSRIFTIVFQSKQANSSEHVILLSNDVIFEESEYFRLQIVAARFTGQAAALFRAQVGLNNTIADVNIQDDDFISVNWTISQPIRVIEGDGVEVRLSGEAFGLYAYPTAIGVICAEALVYIPAFPDLDFSYTPGAKLHFTDVDTDRSFSSNQVVISIINDDIAEPCKILVCALQAGSTGVVRSIEPNRVAINICDDDELIVSWAKDFYRFSENEIATLELVTDSEFARYQVSIQGFPRQIPDRHPNRFPTLVVPGADFLGSAFNATIEQATSQKFGNSVFGNAQVIQSGRTDVVFAVNEFVFTPTSKSAFKNFTIVDDNVLEFDELFIAEFHFDYYYSYGWNVIKGEPSTAFILIEDDDTVEVNFNANSYTVAESDGQVSVSLRVSGQFFVPVWAIIEISDGTATDPEDYSSATQQTRYNVTFHQTAFTDGDDPAPTALSSPILINITQDYVFEGVEYFQARIVETSDRFRVRIGPQDTANVTITDSVTVRYEEALYSVEEEAGYVTLALVLEGDTEIPVTVSVNTLNLQDSSVGDAATALVDYIPRGPFEITFPPGSRRQLYNVTIVDDAIPENSEFLNADVNLARPEDASRITIGRLKQPLIEIQDLVDAAVAIFLDQRTNIIFENERVLTVTLRLNDTYHEDIVVNVKVGELLGIQDLFKARAGVDFPTAGFLEPVAIPAGQTSTQFDVTVIDELIVERDEQFQVSFTYSGSQPKVTMRPGFDEATITIRNDDGLTVMFERQLYPVREDVGSLSYQLIASSTASFPYNVVITAEDGTAICGFDYHEPINTDVLSCGYSLPVTIPVGDNGGSGIVTIINDTIYEGQEEFYLDLSVAPEFQTLRILEGSPLRATVQIEDDDRLRVFFDPASYSVLEGENQVLVLVADKQFEVPFTIDVTLMDITAVAQRDYEDRCYRVEFNVTTQRGTLVVHAEKDNILENDENLKAVLSVPAGVPRVSEGTPSEATVTILDRTAAEVYFDPDIYCVLEGQPVDLTLKLTAEVDPSVTVIVMVQTMDGTAVGPTDYQGGKKHAIFGIGSSMARVQYSAINDSIHEGNESFIAELTVPQEMQDMGIFPGMPDTARVHIIDYQVYNSTVEGSWSPWVEGSCSTLPCGGEGVRTDVRLCNSPTPSYGRVRCEGEQWRNRSCFTCPCGGGWSVWVEGTCSKTCGLGVRLDQRRCTTPDHQECCTGQGLRQRNCSIAECPVHGGWSGWVEVTPCSASCGGGSKVLVRECNEPLPAHGGKDCDGQPFKVDPCNSCPCDAGWSSWVSGACQAPCGQKGTAVATRKCRGPPECCPGEGTRNEMCTSPACHSRR